MFKKTSIAAPRTIPVIVSQILLLACLVSQTFAEDGVTPPRVFTEEPTAGIPKKEGARKQLTCRILYGYPVVYSWSKDGVVVSQNSSGNVFTLMDLKRSDAGYYRCLASNSKGALLSRAVKIDVAYMDELTDGNTEMLQVGEGNAIVLKKPSINSVPDPSIQWLNDGSSLPEESLAHRITLDQDLVLLSLTLASNGKLYNASAYNVGTDKELKKQYTLAVTGTGDSTSHIPPQFIVSPKDTFASVGDKQVQLECIVNARPINYLRIQWFVYSSSGRTKILASSRNRISPFSRQLSIQNPTKNDTGVYECEAILDITGGPTYDAVTAQANITIRESPKISPQLDTTQESDFSDTVTMTCQATGTPLPSLTWYYNGRVINLTSSTRYNSSPNGTLKIANVDLPDAGVYQCFARNIVGEASGSVWLKVNSAPPRLTTTPENLTIVEGKEARFLCKAEGAPQPRISWVKVTGSGDEPIVSDGTVQILLDTLLITTTQKSDSALYKCLATNVKGEASAEARLHVITKTMIIRPPRNFSAILSTSVTLECGVKSDEMITPEWQWYFYKKSTTLEENIVSSGHRLITEQGSLIISGVSGVDIGKYKCVVISPGGNDSRIATLMVVELPSAPVIQSVTLHPTQGNSVIVTWSPSFDGNSPIQRYVISYIVGEQESTVTENVRWESYPAIVPPNATSFVVTNLRASRFYTFRISAINEVGEGPGSVGKPVPPIQLPPQPPGAPPKNFYCSPRPNKEILVQWLPPEEETWNGELTGYQIRYKVDGLPDSAENIKNVSNWSTTTVVLQSLVYHKEYNVKIAAMNVRGVGVFSNVFKVWTLEGRPTAPPTDVRFQSVNSTTILAEWRSPDPLQINGVNQGYTINLRRSSVPQMERALFIPSNPDNPLGPMSAEIYDLLKYTEYVITVSCRTTQGAGPASAEQTVRTQEDVPGAVGDLKFDQIMDSSVRVNWSAPSEINGELQGYTLMYEKKNRTETRQSIDLPPSLNTYTIKKLVPITQYTIYVYASTRKGKGPNKSADIQSNVPPELPGPPHHLGITNLEQTSVLIQFLQGYNGKTSIILWIVEALVGTSTNWQEIYSISDPTASEIKVINLTPFTRYSFRLIAKNIVGRSNASESTKFIQTKMAAPGIPPGNVTVRALNSSALRISWTPVPRTEWHAEEIGYNLDYRMAPINNTITDTTFSTHKLDNGMNVESYILNNLQEWIVYDVRMSSYNVVGKSQYGPITKERTRESVPSASPSNVRAVASSSTSINITWGPVPFLQQNGMIQGYKVKYQSDIEGIDAKYEVIEGNDSLGMVLTKLRKYVTYEIRVQAYTQMGDGVLSQPDVVQTDEDLPGPPIIIYFPMVNYSAAKIVWNPPSEPNGLITGYKVSYRKQGEAESVATSTEVGHSTTEHTVTDLERETYYVFNVVARTRLGWGEKADVLVYTMVDRARPSSPSKPQIGNSQVFSRNVTISWNPGDTNYGPLRNYTIQYRPRDGQWITYPHKTPPNKSSHVITGLNPNTYYRFRVAATNDIGTSDFSLPSEPAYTLPDKPDGAPVNVKVYAVTMTSINATWESPPPQTWNGALQAYIVQYRQLSMLDYAEETVPHQTFSTLIDNLVKSVYYEIRVLAKNNVGRGPPSKPATIFVGEAAPTAPPTQVRLETMSSSEIKVSWNPPPPDTQNGGLSGYKVLYWANTTSEAGKVTPVIVVDTFVVLNKLEMYTQYHATVQAYNLAGEGPKSRVMSASTDEGVPGETGRPMFSNITMDRLTVSWTPPDTPNGIITKYELIYFLKRPNDVEGKLVKLTLNGSQHRISVENLEEYGNYTFQVSARTSKGLGPTRTAHVRTGPQIGSPGRIVDLTIETGSKYISFDWEEGSPGDAPIYGYMVQGRLVGDSTWKTIFQKDSPETSMQVGYQNLIPNSNYKFRVMAMNRYGISEPAMSSQIYMTPGPAVAAVAKPFHTQWWFLIIVGLSGLVVILLIVSVLCFVGRKRQTQKKEMKRSHTTTTVMSDSQEIDDDGFDSLELYRQSQRRTLPRNGTINRNNIYASSRCPPRPSPASVTYSGEDLATGASKSHADDDSSTVTEKPELDESTEASDSESDDMSVTKVPASPPPPPFPGHYANHGEPSQSIRFQSPYNAYAYTDSEADSSHYAMSLNPGVIQFNQSRSRTPLTGFSSFV